LLNEISGESDEISTDQAAYYALMEAIDDEGILSFIDRDSDAELQ